MHIPKGENVLTIREDLANDLEMVDTHEELNVPSPAGAGTTS